MIVAADVPSTDYTNIFDDPISNPCRGRELEPLLK